MQMEITEIVNIKTPTPLAFICANGNSSEATNSSRVHLQKTIYGDKSKADDKPGSMCNHPLTRSIKLISSSQFLQVTLTVKS